MALKGMRVNVDEQGNRDLGSPSILEQINSLYLQ
jgi:hypothetical protein